MSKLFKIVRPKSLTDSSYEAFEYVIRWIGKDGSDYQHMFLDAEIDLMVGNEIINRESSTNIQALIKNESQSVSLKIDDLSLNDLNIILELFSNTFVTRRLKDGTTERFAPDSNRAKYRLKDGRYELEFDLIRADRAKWN